VATLTPDFYHLVYANGACGKTALYALRDVTTGDTCDLVTEFKVVKQAFVQGVTVQGQEVASVSGTVVTVPAGIAQDAVWMLASGVSA
jgi:hypothetical protein